MEFCASMKREKIEFPEKILWSGKRIIAEPDINYANHMGNERILVWADDIRASFLRSIGWDENSFREGKGVIVANHTIAYQSEGFLGDEVNIDVAVDYLTDYSFDVVIRLRKSGSEKNMIVMRTGVVCFDYKKREVAEIPENFLKKMK